MVKVRHLGVPMLRGVTQVYNAPFIFSTPRQKERLPRPRSARVVRFANEAIFTASPRWLSSPIIISSNVERDGFRWLHCNCCLVPQLYCCFMQCRALGTPNVCDSECTGHVEAALINFSYVERFSLKTVASLRKYGGIAHTTFHM